MTAVLKAFVAQDDGEHLGQRGVVIDDQYPLPHGVDGVTESGQFPATHAHVACQPSSAVTRPTGSTSRPTTVQGPYHCRAANSA